MHSVFAYALKFIYNPKINTCSAFVVIPGHEPSNEKFGSSNMHIPSGEVEQGSSLCLLVSALVSKQVFSSHSLCSVVFPHFGAFCR